MEKSLMKNDKKNVLLLVLLLLAFLLSGCSISRGPAEVILQPDFTEKQSRYAGMPKRFQESAPQGPTVVESAMELSKKYAKLSDEAAVLRSEKQNLIVENRHFKEKLIASEARLKQAQKELTEANDLLIQMRIELNSWKVDVIGFRDEMRQADKAQLETLLKILKVLGGEVPTEAAQRQDSDKTADLLASSG
jgi:septal ring factor EnvC (AmiA/AmiB activator)